MIRPSSTDILKAAFLLILFSRFGLAQTGVIEGTLRDATGAVISAAKVVALDEAKSIVARETTSGPDGRFQLRPLLRGLYTVKAESKGFKALERTGLTLDPNQTMDLGELTLELGQTTEQVTVEAQIPLVETSGG
jgi:hypothetical protein